MARERFSDVLEWEWDGYFYTRKNGKRGRFIQTFVPHTPLRTCWVCGWTSTPRNVMCRNDCHRERWGTPLLCTGCWNVVRTVVRKFDELAELRRLANKLRRAKREDRYDAGPAQHAVGSAGGGEVREAGPEAGSDDGAARGPDDPLGRDRAGVFEGGLDAGQARAGHQPRPAGPGRTEAGSAGPAAGPCAPGTGGEELIR